MGHVKSFDELSPLELHRLYKERTKVFVVEQQCAYLEADDKDLISTHMFKMTDGQVIANARIYETQENKVHIGRILVKKEYRGKGLAKELMQRAIDFMEDTYPGQTIEMMAEEYVQGLYEEFGFEVVSEPLVSEGILHVWMEKEPETITMNN